MPEGAKVIFACEDIVLSFMLSFFCYASLDRRTHSIVERDAVIQGARVAFNKNPFWLGSCCVSYNKHWLKTSSCSCRVLGFLLILRKIKNIYFFLKNNKNPRTRHEQQCILPNDYYMKRNKNPGQTGSCWDLLKNPRSTCPDVIKM